MSYEEEDTCVASDSRSLSQTTSRASAACTHIACVRAVHVCTGIQRSV
jgi:hypothetical protein